MRASLPPEILYAVRIPTWHALFSARGYPPSVTPSTDSLDAIADAIARADLPVPLARAVFTLSAFATEAARADVYNAADALAFPTRWPAATSPADLVAQILASSTDDDAVAALLDAAQTLRDRAFRPRTTHVYVGAPGIDPAIGEPTQYVDPWRAELATWAKRRDFGAIVAVDARSAAGVLSYEIVHEDRTVTRLLAASSPTTKKKKKKKAPRFTPVTHRPLRSHQLSYDPSARKLSITTDCMEAVTPLAKAAGFVFFGDRRHFFDTRAVDLWKLQELGARALEVPELSQLSVSAIGGTWHSGKKHAITPRGQDFFEALARYKIRIEGGRLNLVTLRALRASIDGGPSQCDVVINPPHLLTVSEPELAPLMHAYLDAAKITTPDARLRDFFSWQPWIDSRAGWIANEGEDGFAALVASGLLKADPSNRSVAPPDDPHAGRTATAYPLRGKKFIAWSADPTVAPFVVEEAALVVYALSFARLAAVIAEALGLQGPTSALDDDGVLYCGRRALGPTHVLLFLLTRPIRPATLKRLSEAAEHGHAVLITPEGRMQEGALRQLSMPKLAGPWRPLLGATVRTLRLASFVDTTLYAPVDARVVVHRATNRVWIDGVLCTLSEIHVRLLEILIRHAGQVVHTKDIAEHVAQGKPHADTTRKAVESLAIAVEKSFKASKKRPPKDLKSLVTMPRNGHYTLNAKGFVD